MPISLPADLVEHYLLGHQGDRRQLQDSPVLGDVWLAFASLPGESQQLLVTPYREQAANTVAVEIDELIASEREKSKTHHNEPIEVAFLQGFVAARLHFEEMLRVVVPLTTWWKKALASPEVAKLDVTNRQILTARVARTIRQMTQPVATFAFHKDDLSLLAFDRFVVLAGVILWAARLERNLRPGEDVRQLVIADADGIADAIAELIHAITRPLKFSREDVKLPLIYQVSLNRHVSTALKRSVPAVKADAARNLFKVDCSSISWAVIDSGIQGNHIAFRGDGKSRVKASFDFSNYQRIVNLDNRRIFAPSADSKRKAARLRELLRGRNLKNPPDGETAERMLYQLSNDLASRRPLHWEFVQPFVEIKINTAPVNDHGTHVAGIIGACGEGDSDASATDGICPDIGIYDFRVLSRDRRNTEFNVIAALQFIRHMNERSDYILIHGANLSLSIPHNVRNYACGRTPVCVECERLVDTGVVVVAAAGNFGYQSFTTRDGSYDSYAAFSITDPGNADGVITVGSTHRSAPHTYGVSFFSSRGPTGDGRSKPDIVAPGERIRAPFRTGWGDLDGTSMAAPHVSGAAAMLLARYTELIGRPRRIKQILCDSATDLGRERSFQGAGMLDVLRAFQKL
ncbi:peptidase S8/S53 subtilisin kexin sedolisin [Rhizobium leguminosarum bv. viciae]|nr:peptidase S8/S53 subtilisin kexin sedolisin [Rhizobium leguminosarum bv. viciae]